MMRDTGLFRFPDTHWDGSAIGSQSINADAMAVANVLYAPVALSVDKIAVYINSTTTAGDLVATIETVTPSTMNPTGTLYHANATVTKSMLATDDNVMMEYSFPSAIDIAAGDLVAFQLARVSGTFAGNIGRNNTGPAAMPASRTRNSSSVWSGVSGRIIMAIHDVNRGWLSVTLGMTPFTSVGSGLNISNTNEAGVKIVMPFTARCFGMEGYVGSIGASEGFTVLLYDSSDTVLCFTTFVNGTNWIGGANSTIQNFWEPVILRKGQTYRVAILAIGTISILTSSVATGFELATGMTNVELTTRAGGSWSDTVGTFPRINLFLDQIGTNSPASGLVR